MEPNQLLTNWMSGEELLDIMEMGDLVEIKRQQYTHWVVFMGDEGDGPMIIHYSTESGDIGEGSGSSKGEFTSKIIHGSTAHVRVDSFLTIVSSDRCRINNSLDRRYSPFPPVIIIDRAAMKLGNSGYNVLWNNCEHFVKWCRYGNHESEQAYLAQTGIIGATALAVTGSLPLSVGVGLASFVVLKTGRAIQRSFIWRAFL